MNEYMRMADRMYDLSNQFEQLKKENAELKKINSETLTQLNLDNGELIIENEKLRKENEGLKAGRQQWHYVKDGDLPKDEDYKCCISSNGVYYVARYEELFVSWTNQENKEVCCPYAWCEIPTFDKE